MRGWHYESWRHSLAARRIPTQYYATKWSVQRLEPGTVYPVSPADVRSVVFRKRADDARGIRAVRFMRPRTEEHRNAWAQYVRGKRELRVFAQPKEEVTEETHNMVMYAAVPHEVGHHVALYKRQITDPDLRVAEARATAYASGFDVEDKDVKGFVRRELGSSPVGSETFEDGVKKELHPFKSAAQRWVVYSKAAGHPEKISSDPLGRAVQEGAAIVGRVVTQENVVPMVKKSWWREPSRDKMIDVLFGEERA